MGDWQVPGEDGRLQMPTRRALGDGRYGVYWCHQLPGGQEVYRPICAVPWRWAVHVVTECLVLFAGWTGGSHFVQRSVVAFERPEDDGVD